MELKVYKESAIGPGGIGLVAYHSISLQITSAR